MPSALVLLAPGFEEIEAITVIDLLRRADIEVTVAGLVKNTVNGSHNITVLPDSYYLDENPDRYDVLILPGGQPGTDNLKNNPTILDWVRRRFTGRKKTAAICAAPVVLHAAGITGGLKITSYPAEKEKLSGTHYLEDTVVKDGPIITSRGVGTALDFALALIEELRGHTAAKTIAEKILKK